jgi:hypothetical protein
MTRRFAADISPFSTVPAFLSMALLVLALGCATRDPNQPTSISTRTVHPLVTNSPAPASTTTETGLPSPTPQPVETGSTPTATATAEGKTNGASVPVGSEVGERIPDFALNLANGSTVTSQQLLSQGQPAFLFLFVLGDRYVALSCSA